MFGLLDSNIILIKNVLENHPEVKQAYIFGSRARGNYRNGSDVDIALKGDGILFKNVLTIASFLNEETLMPYQFDVLDYASIQAEQLVDHIDRMGILFYEKV